MKKAKQILAIIGIILLVLLYALTLFAAIFEPANTMNYLSAAIMATIIIPVVIWAIQLFFKITNRDAFSDLNQAEENQKESDSGVDKKSDNG